LHREEDLSNDGQVISLERAWTSIPGPAGEHSVSLLRHGTAHVKLSRPVRPNVQAPHEQDEIYVIVRGHGTLVLDGRRNRCQAGDLAFVPAGTEHHFEDFTDDLAVWVVFYGPLGGEAPAE
jgi:mannose-6-phosphate isomerase-like protein (cupin superfamily)